MDYFCWEILARPRIVDILRELMILIAPVWIAVIVGVLVGWMWKPKWASTSLGSIPSLSLSSTCDCHEKEGSSTSYSDSSSLSHSQLEEEKQKLVNENDLEYIYKLVEEEDGGPAWIQMMDRTTSTMRYQGWRRDLETGPPQYKSRTIYENATPEMVRDFFWDDHFRLKWDDMLISATTLAECPTTGTMVVHWVRKFPFFCSDREYIIGRRIWEAGRSYYCVTKSVACSSVPRRNKPRRVDLYYSSWCIRAVESRKGDGEVSGCEVVLFHYEDMGIPWEIAKLGVRQGMWGAAKKIDGGLRAYQKERLSVGSQLMPQINTKVNVQYLRCLENSTHHSFEDASERPVGVGNNIPKLVVVGGAIVLTYCTIDPGLLTKAFGIARTLAKIGRKF